MKGSRRMVCELDDQKVEVEVRLDGSFKAIRYELTSEKEIAPLDACYCLWLVIKNVCDTAGVSVPEFLSNYGMLIDDDGQAGPLQ